MESSTLITASTYLNNLLLARGLLRNSKSVDFAKPARETRAQIINLVHDLLLQRDRHEEAREDAADMIRHMRIEAERRDADLEKLRTRLAEKERAVTQAKIETRNAAADLKKVQSSVKTLQSQLVKTKALCDQIKTQCANDIRKRDLHIEKLKSHLHGQQRGNKSLVVAPSISITGGSGSRSNLGASVRSLADPEYSLKQESNEFLIKLTADLCDENDALVSLARSTLASLRVLLGVEGDGPDDNTVDEAVSKHDRITTETEGLMETLRTLLSNPNFVSVEEVDIRDDEIARLREGWEMMETRWKDVLLMMDGWRKRLEKEGDMINIDDLKRGLGLSMNLEELRQHISPARPPRQPISRLPRPSTRNLLSEEATRESESISRDSGVSGMTADDDAQKQSTTSLSRGSLEPPSFFDLRPEKSSSQQLRQLDGNFQSPRRVMFQDVADDSSMADMSLPGNVKTERGGAKASPTENYTLMVEQRQRMTRSRKRSPSPTPATIERSAKQHMSESKQLQSSSFLEDPPRLTLEEKLLAAQTEADEARLHPVPSAAAAAVTGNGAEGSEVDLDMVSSLRSPVKKSKIKGRPRRRKSTLAPEELASLLNLD